MQNTPIPIHLPVCKSIAARMLMLNAYSEIIPKTSPFSPRDIEILSRALSALLTVEKSQKKREGSKPSAPLTINIGDNGTAMRLLTPFAASRPGLITILEGSERMNERPIAPLVTALRSVGATIEYLGREGYPPLLIKGKALEFKEIEIDGSLSSQFVSALLLLCASMPGKPEVKVTGLPASAPYINLTRLCIEQRPSRIPPDWSSASYLYEAAAIGATSKIISLNDLTLRGLPQPDMRAAEIFRELGVKSHEFNGCMLLKRVETPAADGIREYDLSSTPDLTPAVAVTLAEQGIPFRLTGIGNLRIKESDRIAALADELAKLGIVTGQTDDTLSMLQPQKITSEPVTLSAHNDHRIYMAFAILTLKYPNITIEGNGCADKSFPLFDLSVLYNLKEK